MKNFSKLSRGFALSFIAAGVIGSMTGCSRIETGSVGILKHWGGEISTQAQTGIVVTIFDSIVEHIDTTESRVKIENLRPADAKGVQLDDLDVVLSVRLDGEKVPGFYINTKELDAYTDESGHKVTTVGLNVFKNVASHAINEVTKNYQMSQLSGKLPEFENAIKIKVQTELDAGYPGVFKLVRVNVNNLRLPEGVMKQATAMANLDMEKERIAKEMELIGQRKALKEQETLIDAEALKSSMAKTGLQAKDIIDWKNAKSYGEQAAAMGSKAAPVIDPARQPASKP